MSALKRLNLAFCYSLLTVVVLLAVVLVWGISRFGQWLVVEDPLKPASVIVVLSGEIPFRAMEAARLYRRGYASAVWLTHGPKGPEERALDALGVSYMRDEAYNREILEKMGVPDSAIRLLPDPILNTAVELRLVSRELNKMGADKVIIVTSKPHTRRVKTIWRVMVGNNPQAEVEYPSDDPFDANRWWKDTTDALEVSREFFGLLNVWAGFPVQPDHR